MGGQLGGLEHMNPGSKKVVKNILNIQWAILMSILIFMKKHFGLNFENERHV